MSVYSYARQVRAVLLIELAILTFAFVVALSFWTNLCDGGTLESCLATANADGTLTKSPLTFLLLSAVRPFVFTPFFFVAAIGGNAFGPVLGAILTALGSVLSCLAVFGITKLIGRRLAKPWLRSNLPATFKLLRSQDYKLAFAMRLVPILPFDLASFLFGALDFRTKSVIFATFFGALPEAYLYAKMVDPNETLLSSTIISITGFCVSIFVPLLVFEFLSRKKGTSLWQLTKAMYREINYEVQTNNDIVKRQTFDPTKPPVLLLYGFFSSRRAVTVLERMLTTRGHQVLSFNLGGLMGTFFTRDIIETASFIDYKIKRQFDRHGFQKLHIVAHSKGGMVALWWLTRLGGAKWCDKVITMGTPYRGSLLTYLALVTPLGLIWKDVGQMRPGSSFLKSLHDVALPDNVNVYCFHSERDRVARGKAGVYMPREGKERVHSLAMNHISHFEFLYRRDVGDAISSILKGDADANHAEAPRPANAKLPLALP